MSIDYLEEIATRIDDGDLVYVCPGTRQNDWVISSNLGELRSKAQRAANTRRFEAGIFRLVNDRDTGATDSFLIVREILEPGPRGEPHMKWSLVDTRDAAEIMRDVSQGPTPFFGAVKEETFQPEEAAAQ